MDRAGFSIVERIARRDLTVVLVAVGVVLLLAGSYTVLGVGMEMSALEMTRMAGASPGPGGMAMSAEWSAAQALLMFLMWWVMMIAMMTPSATPTLLIFATLKREGDDPRSAPLETSKFLAGYLFAWAAFSLAATLAQWSLVLQGVVSSEMMVLNSQAIGGTVLIAAGLYQFTNLKNACLKHCRSPVQFLTEHRRTGPVGPLIMGAHHGIFCLGCCWALMALLFVGGIMNLFWIVGLAIYVLIEKWAPHGLFIARGAGAVAIISGVILVYLAVA